MVRDVPFTAMSAETQHTEEMGIERIRLNEQQAMWASLKDRRRHELIAGASGFFSAVASPSRRPLDTSAKQLHRMMAHGTLRLKFADVVGSRRIVFQRTPPVWDEMRHQIRQRTADVSYTALFAAC